MSVTEIQADQFEDEVLAAAGPVVVDFYSTECPPCEALFPKYEDVAGRFSSRVKFLKIFRQGNRELALKLGVTSSPTLLFYKGGREVGQRLIAGIKKQAIVTEIQSLLDPADFQKLNVARPVRRENLDLIILGGGPAGLSAALYAAQAKLNTVLVDQSMPGGQVTTTHLIANYPGTGKAIPGYELIHNMQAQVKEAGGRILAAMDISSVTFSSSGGPHRVLLDGELELSAPAAILAMGAEPRLLGVPGEKEFRGRGISYCATCDGKFYQDLELIVIGGGNSAVEESLFLTRFARKITVVHQFDTLQANKTAQEAALAHEAIHFVWDSEPRSFQMDENNRMHVMVENRKTGQSTELIADGVFIFVGLRPNVQGFEQLKQNEQGYVLTNEDMETSLPGVYAIGDVRQKKVRQAITAAADGCVAAVMAEKYIEKQKVY
ncbi:MAG: FAD-dependent oxidoreductase [Spirochaetales bacterium]|nr:FAD-dependent oxidoreductase [Spirochaetales bacterium]